MRYCPNCGVTLKSENAKFCSECGSPLTLSSGSEKVIQGVDEKEFRANIFELGTQLEEVVEKIYRAKGYATERRRRLQGKSTTRSEIDIVAKRGSRIIAIECKNYSYPVGIDKIRDFNQKLQDLGLQGVFVTYKGLTSDASQFAQSQNIVTLDSGELMEKWWALSIGRENEDLTAEYVTLESALPLNFNFFQATKLGFD